MKNSIMRRNNLLSSGLLLVATIASSATAFSPARSSFLTTQRAVKVVVPTRSADCLLFSSNEPTEGEGAGDNMSYEDAETAIRDEDDLIRLERSGGADDEFTKKFNAKKTEYDAMRDRIRARTADMGIAKSVATAEAIAEANRRAQSGEKAGESELNMSVFAEKTPAASFADADAGANPMLDDGTDSLTDEEKKEIDKIAQLNFFDQAKSEFSFAKWPSISATLKLAAAMFVLFLFTAGFILKADEIIRLTFTNVGLIPRPDQIYDYSELQLPDNWMMDGGNQAIDGVADAVKGAASASKSLPDL
mmetsp:Transcript_16597/g.30194  ORF Transcript_16597/g.30194 Transcript_16597/m.30194 type:complete len:305 (-) Transcript_16597:392-1306(-)|eukprot:CAMPEP_0198297400 /NCGR_PEP_ID=MMETSP1449-20131203/36793_1 /TAXON_ID=420275 /ORGANISM="Attheya septentrionalis, Strain CCMP2084" /LENGTH=304 /DNA_ID=CAMNT_0043998319 /DNA_START=184 /DNA_END=1098 /DNA_ORIENTATION=+